ncbi:MAG: DUF1592 domain-containing protein [Planctomycetaceae bacterium]|nr:DUF1592 domain-containing protein [Planctomycetaceae bacterium]
MTFRVRCPKCGSRFQLRAEDAGKRGVCPNAACRFQFRIPAAPAEPQQKSGNEPPKATPVADRVPIPVAEKVAPQGTTGKPSPAKATKRPTSGAKPPAGKPARATSKAPRRKSAPAPDPADDFLSDDFFSEEFDDEVYEAEADFELPSTSKRGSKSKSGKKRGKGKGKSRKSGKGLPWLWIGSAALALLLVIGLVVQFLSPGSGEGPLSSTLAAAEESLPPAAKLDYAKDVQPFFKKYCYDCHGPDFQEEGVEFHRYSDLASIQSDRKLWNKAFNLVKVGAMPPSDSDQPTEAERQQVVDFLDYALFYVNCDLQEDPGRVTVHRLNRNEYNNTVRDLLGVDFRPADDFPSDDVGYGFDNIGDVLSVPPLLIEKYLDAAEQVASRAILTANPDAIERHIDAAKLKTEGTAAPNNGGLTMASRGAGFETFDFPSNGDYVLRVRASASQAGTEVAKLQVKLGDKSIQIFDVDGDRTAKNFEVQFHTSKGKQRLALEFINDFYDPEAENPKRRDRNMYLHWVELEGPLGLPEELPSSHRELVKVTPTDGVSPRDAAQSNLRDFLPRAFRRPVTEAEIAEYARFVDLAVEQGEPFEMGMQVVLQAVLVSPNFLFRVEDQSVVPGKKEVPIDDFALASRLSYFLWSSMPDAELLELAGNSRLHDPDVLAQQTKRMLADPKSDAMIQNFSGQWLGLRKLATNEVAPDPQIFPMFNEQLRQDFWKETELFFGNAVRENRSIYDLLDARYTFVNERLANFYGIPDVKGPEFRKVTLTDGRRAGLLTQGSILTLTSYPNRTSPVKRGQWVLENLLGTPPPEAPPVVPALEDTQQANPNLSFREQLVLHRSDPGCASCHKLMDDIGFGLQNFDAIGRWREKEGEHPVDSSGVLPTGESFNGPIELISILRKRKEQFGRCLAEKLLTFALGRGVEFQDKCAIDKILDDLNKDETFETLVLGVVQSRPFLMRRGNPTQE